jgi:hypothetical protein
MTSRRKASILAFSVAAVARLAKTISSIQLAGHMGPAGRFCQALAAAVMPQADKACIGKAACVSRAARHGE